MFRSTTNPALRQTIFERARQDAQSTGVMTIKGSLSKFGFLLIMLLAGAAYTWQRYYTGQSITGLMIIGLIGGLIGAIFIMFKPKWAGVIAPAYGILEGFLIGGLSAFINQTFAKSYPNLVIQAVGLTIGVAIAMFLLYSFRIIRATEKFKSIIITATFGIAIFYFITMIVRMFGVNMPFLDFGNGGMLGIGISLFVVAIAALNLILDFDLIEQGATMGAPKYMEWYGAFALLITIVWLYIEILRLLSRFGGRQ